jgi:sialic acid synthase SpsE
MTNPVKVIAEMAWSHDGSVELAEKIVRDAAAAGADAVSVHFTDMPDYMVRHYGSGPGRVSAGKDTKPIYDYLVEINLTQDHWRRVAKAAAEVKLDLVVMPNDPASLAFAETLAPAAYVLSAAAFEEWNFIRDVGRKGRAVYLRVGGATLGEIEKAIDLLREVGCEDITLLYGHQNYPTKIEDTNLAFLTCLINTFGLPVGIADHVDADDEFALAAPLMAIPLGISCIEKHITHDRAKKGEDFESALNGDELKRLVELVRKGERALGRVHAVGLDASSAAYRRNSRKRLVAACDIAAGSVLTEEMVASKRSDEGEPGARRELVVGRKALAAFAKDDGITLDRLGAREG